MIRGNFVIPSCIHVEPDRGMCDPFSRPGYVSGTVKRRRADDQDVSGRELGRDESRGFESAASILFPPGVEVDRGGASSPTIPSDVQTAVISAYPAERNPECRASTVPDGPVGCVLVPGKVSMILVLEKNQILENLHFLSEEFLDDTP